MPRITKGGAGLTSYWERGGGKRKQGKRGRVYSLLKELIGGAKKEGRQKTNKRSRTRLLCLEDVAQGEGEGIRQEKGVEKDET